MNKVRWQRRRYALISLLLVVPASIGVWRFWPTTTIVESTPADVAPVTKKPTTAETTVSNLVKLDWEQDTATAVAQLNQRYLELLNENSVEQTERLLALWGRLGNRSLVQNRLRSSPELAGLLMGALTYDADGPELILKSIPETGDANFVLSMYALAGTPDDSVRLARILDRDGDLVVRLWKMGVVDAAEWFDSLPENVDARFEYRQWLRLMFESVLNRAEDVREEALFRVQTLLTIHGRNVRHLLDQDETFRRDFLPKHWPAFRQILERKTDDLAWGECVCEPDVWRLFARFGQVGVDKYAKYGSVAVDLLLCPEYQPCSRQVFEAFDNADELALSALFDDELRKNPLFVELLKRNLPGGHLAKALHELMARPAEQPELLRQWKRIGDVSLEGLKEDLGPPPEGVVTWLPGYSVYYLGRKLAQGRDVGALDVAGAAVDAATAVIMVPEAAQGLRVIGQGLAKSLQKGGMQAATKWAMKAGTKEFYPWVIRDAQQLAMKPRSLFTKVSQLDVTDAVRFSFQRAGTKSSTFKQITKLDARIFMRADRRVVFHPTKLLGNGIVGPLLIETGTNAGFEFGANAVVPVVQVAAVKVAQQNLAWRQHLSLWWLISNDGSLDRREKKN